MKTVAESCGFSSLSTFFRVFKAEFGVTPMEYYQSGKTTPAEEESPSLDFSEDQEGQNESDGTNMIRF
jgi:AraC-like DNA-binding protein